MASKYVCLFCGLRRYQKCTRQSVGCSPGHVGFRTTIFQRRSITTSSLRPALQRKHSIIPVTDNFEISQSTALQPILLSFPLSRSKNHRHIETHSYILHYLHEFTLNPYDGDLSLMKTFRVGTSFSIFYSNMCSLDHRFLVNSFLLLFLYLLSFWDALTFTFPFVRLCYVMIFFAAYEPTEFSVTFFG